MKVRKIRLSEWDSAVILNDGRDTRNVRFGVTRLKKGMKVGLHTTGKNEEVIYVIEGNGRLLIEGGELKIEKGDAVYIPPETEHDVIGDSQDELLYVFFVATSGR
ncbi:MAG: cupin domain-containing protein [Candidatus Asgardarchaeia archaeon]